MQSVVLLSRILGSLFYYSPKNEQIYALWSQLNSLPELYNQHDADIVKQLWQGVELPAKEDLVYHFSVLFEGQGKMEVPPWGAVYLDKDNLLMSDSTIDYRQFLLQNQLHFTSPINEPEDQFGLMLLAFNQFMEQEKEGVAIELLEKHLLPWAYRYLTLLSTNSVSQPYAVLAKMAELFLQDLQATYQLKPVELRLYF